MATLMLGTVFGQTRRKYQLKLLVGEAGLHRSLRWIYFSENIATEDFLRGGELVVFTGFSFESKEEFEAYIQMLIRKNCCGAIINVGKYLFEEDLSEELLALCEAAQFPLIAMPWKYHLTDILQEFSRYIFLYKQEQAQASYVFQKRLEGENPFSEDDEMRLVSNQFNPQGKYCVCVLACRSETMDEPPDSIVQDICVLAENQINQALEHSCVLPFRNQAILIFHEAARAEIQTQLDLIIKLCGRTFSDWQAFCGTGGVITGVESLKVSYDQACAAMLYAKNQNASSLSFDDMGEFQLFYTCRDRAILEQQAAILLPLKKYESQYGEEITKTLRLYLEFDGSIQRISEVLGCHRNTVNYRMNKVETLLKIDLEDRQTRFQFHLAFLIEEYLQLYSSPAQTQI